MAGTTHDTRDVANYARESHGKKKSQEDQLKENRASLHELGYDDERIRSYSDKVSSSRFATRVRVGWPELLDDLENDRLRLVCLWEASRGDRTVTSWSQFLDLCRLRAVLIYSVVNERMYDVRRPDDWKALINDGVDAQMESEKISMRVRRGTRNAAEAGKPHGKVPYGFKRIYDAATGEFIAQVPDETVYTTESGHTYKPADVVRFVFDSVLRDVPSGQICRTLNDLQIPSPQLFATVQRGTDERIEERKDVLWSQGPMLELCKKISYIGTRTHLGALIPNAWEPVVDAETFYTVQNLIANPARRTNKGGVKATHLMSYLMRCKCGGHMARSGRVYKCQRASRIKRDGIIRHATITGTKLDAYIESIVLGFLADPRSFERMGQEMGRNEAAAHARAEAERLRAELAYVKQSAKDPKKPHTTWADFEEMAERLQPQIDEFEREAQYSGVPADVLSLVGKDVVAEWAGRTMVQKRQIVRSLLTVMVSPLAGTKHEPITTRVTAEFTF